MVEVPFGEILGDFGNTDIQNDNNEADKNKTKSKTKTKTKVEGAGVTKKKIPIKKYSQNGLGRLHESIIVDTTSKFVHLDKDQKPHFVNEIERANDILVPADTIDTQNPIPFIFDYLGNN